MKITLSILVLSLFVLNGVVHAASPVTEKAVRYYKAAKYDSTINFIKSYLKKYGKSPETQTLVPILTESLVRKGNYSLAHRFIQMYRLKYPESAYKGRMWYLEGVAYAKEEKFTDALESFSGGLYSGLSRSLDSMTIANSETICNQMTEDELTGITSMEVSPRIIEIAGFYSISKYFSAGQFTRVQTGGEQFRNEFPNSRFETQVRDFMARAKDQEKNQIQIGILSPISGEDADIGKKVLQGAQLAISMNGQNSPSIKCIVRDEKGDMIETARCTKELLENYKVHVILGPVLSQTATVCAAMVMGKNAVMLSPTATDDGIAELGNNIFQMNLSLGVLARKIAKYAVENLNIKEFAIVSPNTPYGVLMTNCFKDELKKRKAEIVAEETFDEGGNDFTPQMMNLRTKLLYRQLEKLAIEKGIDFKGKVTRADSVKWADSSLSVGGLFMPAEAEDVVMLAPQVAFNRIKTQLLGSSGWHSQKVIDDGKQYVQNALMSTGFEINQNQKEWLDFRKAYKARFNSEPDRIAALGFDAANILIKAIKETGSDNTERLSEAISKIQGYQGVSGLISFDKSSGANIEAAIMKISTNGFVRVQ